MPKTETTLITPRRNFLVGALMATAIPKALLNPKDPDPAFAVIAKHRQAEIEHLNSIFATDREVFGTRAYRMADDYTTECAYRSQDAADAIATTVPTTLAGVVAVLNYANEYEDGDDGLGGEWPGTDTIGKEGWHYQLRQSIAKAAANLQASA